MKNLFLSLTLILFLTTAAFAGTIQTGSITVTASATGFADVAAVPADADSALITVEIGAVRFWNKGDPTATVGILLNVGDSVNILGNHDVNSFRVIRNSGVGIATVRYMIFD